jgi:hypothetical protein
MSSALAYAPLTQVAPVTARRLPVPITVASPGANCSCAKRALICAIGVALPAIATPTRSWTQLTARSVTAAGRDAGSSRQTKETSSRVADILISDRDGGANGHFAAGLRNNITPGEAPTANRARAAIGTSRHDPVSPPTTPAFRRRSACERTVFPRPTAPGHPP